MRGRNRGHVKARIRDLATHFYADEPITVSYNLDTQPEHDSRFALGLCEGANEPEDLTGRLFTDRFVIKTRIEVHGHANAEEAELEAERFLRIFEDRIGEAHGLTHPDVPHENDPDTDQPYFAGAQTPYIGAVDGPMSGIPDGGGSLVAWIDFDIECRCHITRST